MNRKVHFIKKSPLKDINEISFSISRHRTELESDRPTSLHIRCHENCFDHLHVRVVLMDNEKILRKDSFFVECDIFPLEKIRKS